MNQATGCADGAATFVEPLLQFWTRSAQQNVEWTRTLLEGAQEATDFTGHRRRWLDALAESLDAYMRTPAFLEMMRKNFELATEAKSRGEDVAQELARQVGTPRMSDVSGLFERLQIGQKSISDRLRAIEARLDALDGERANGASSSGSAKGGRTRGDRKHPHPE
jgi:hypothetical protein